MQLPHAWGARCIIPRPVASLPPEDSPEAQVGSQPCLCPFYYVQCGLFSKFTFGKSVQLVLGSFSRLLTIMWVYLAIHKGQVGPRIVLLHHILWKFQELLFTFYIAPTPPKQSNLCQV